MTPLFHSVSAITPAQAPVFACFGCVVIPSLASYFVPDGTIHTSNVNYNGNGPPLPGPILRVITSFSTRIEASGGVTAGSPLLYALCPDGNWHQSAKNQVNLTANQIYSCGAAFGTTFQTVVNSDPHPPPVLGLMWRINLALAGGNINYLEVRAKCEDIDVGYIHGAKLGVLIQ